MATTRGQFFRVETIAGDYGSGLRVFAEWPVGLTPDQAEQFQIELAEKLTQIESVVNSTTTNE